MSTPPVTAAVLAALLALPMAASGQSPAAPAPAVPPLPDRGLRTVSVSTVAQLQQAVAQITSGTTILIQPGTYRLTRTLYVNRRVTNVAIRGASGDRDAVTIVGGGMRNPSGAVPFGIWTGGEMVDDIVIADLTIRDFREHAIILNPNTRQPHIYNVRLLDIGDQFVKGNPDPAGEGVHDGILEHSVVEFTTTAPDSYVNGIDVHGGRRWVVRRNVFRNITTQAGGGLAGPAVLFWNKSADTVTEANLFVNCARGISYGLIDRAGATDHSGGIIRNNIVFRAAGQRGDVGIHVADSPDTQVLNNTIVLSGTYASAIEYRYASAARLMIANNIADGQVWARDGATATVRNNLTTATPALFADARAGDLHLAPSAAAAIDKGLAEVDVPDDIDGDTRPAGSAYDLGADEFVPPSDR